MMKRFARAVVLAAIVGATILVIAFAGKVADKDYISYWSAGQLLTHHADPYAYSQVFALEKEQGYTPARPILMRNPPWVLFLVAPLGSVSARCGLILWTAAAVGCIMAFLRLFRIAPRDRPLAFCFAPAFACFSSGQSSPFLLLGFSLFVGLNRRRPFAAGAALLFLAIKPHLFLVLWPILLIDCFYRRNLRVLAGAALALLAATAFAMYVDPRVWTHYLTMLRDSHLSAEFLQTPAYLLRYALAPNSLWVQFVPSMLAIAWAVWFYARNRRTWDWSVQAMPLLLVTVLVSPYAWMTDEIVLLPAIMLALATQNKPKLSTALFLALNGIALVMVATQVQLASGAYLWTSTAWLAWYLYSRRSMVVTGEA